MSGAMTVTTERRGAILLVTIDRPARRNAIDAETTAALDAALNELDDDPGLWAGVLAGTPVAFSAGTDLVAGPGAPTPRGGNYGVVRRDRAHAADRGRRGRWPTAAGSRSCWPATWSSPPATRGSRCPRPRAGWSPTAARCSGRRARCRRNIARRCCSPANRSAPSGRGRSGLVNRLVEPGEAVAAALELAETVAAHSPVAQAATLAAIGEIEAVLDGPGWAATERASATAHASADAAEGIAAFREKREPRWPGR